MDDLFSDFWEYCGTFCRYQGKDYIQQKKQNNKLNNKAARRTPFVITVPAETPHIVALKLSP